MNKFTCNGFRPITGTIGFYDAADRFAYVAARREFGRNGIVRTCTQTAYSENGMLAEYSAFIGRRTGQHETTGHNINFTVYLAKA